MMSPLYRLFQRFLTNPVLLCPKYSHRHLPHPTPSREYRNTSSSTGNVSFSAVYYIPSRNESQEFLEFGGESEYDAIIFVVLFMFFPFSHPYNVLRMVPLLSSSYTP